MKLRKCRFGGVSRGSKGRMVRSGLGSFEVGRARLACRADLALALIMQLNHSRNQSHMRNVNEPVNP